MLYVPCFALPLAPSQLAICVRYAEEYYVQLPSKLIKVELNVYFKSGIGERTQHLKSCSMNVHVYSRR